MDSNTLSDFRVALYACFLRAGDALMNTADALLTDTSAHSFVELSLAACFERRWPSLYKAFENAVIDRQALQRLFARFAPLPTPQQRLVLGVDASSIARPLSKTARDRTYVHASNLPEGSKPVVAGWQFSTLAVLPKTPSSWTYVLDNQRIKSTATQGEVAALQLQTLVPLLPAGALLLGDGYYGNVTFLRLTEAIACDKLLRFAKNRLLYRPAPPRPNKPGPGAPKKDGDVFKCHDASTQGCPDACWEEPDANGQAVAVACWHNLHFKDARQITVSVLRVTRHAAKDTKRDPKVSWFVFAGQSLPPLEQIPALYARRYSLEHGFRVDKQELLWEQVRLRTPEAYQHWTDMVACVRNQLCLSREIGASRQPWERKQRPVTPSQVRRAMGTIIRQLGTPARVCQVRGNSPGRRKGAIVGKAPRFKVVFKDTVKATKPTKKV
jgi:hypothetical protein